MFKEIFDENDEHDFDAMGEPTTQQILNGIENSLVYPDDMVVVADWNDIDNWISDYLDYYGYQCQYPDESAQCDNCYCYLHLNASDYISHEHGFTCRDCVLENPEEFIEDFVFWSDSMPYIPIAVPSWLVPHLEKSNMVPFYSKDSACKDGFESGYYRGMNDTPEKVAKLVHEELGLVEMCFCINYSNPFMVDFSAYIRRKHSE